MTIACNRHMSGRGIRSTSIWPKGRMHLQPLDNLVDETAYMMPTDASIASIMLAQLP